ncbi:hypothetical protein [Neisseria chenwenguii]|uniref:hypothetical protein n=1 Tax=Neisseria chenwenguii TaxID=1853278 RepID=UPI000F510F88|nr:hypothetical protein [Neisseria chenwenguii]
MLIKSADDKNSRVKLLEDLQNKPLNEQQRKWVNEQLWALKTGIQGEKDAAFYINSVYKDEKSSVIFHDLRIEIGTAKASRKRQPDMCGLPAESYSGSGTLLPSPFRTLQRADLLPYPSAASGFGQTCCHSANRKNRIRIRMCRRNRRSVL